MFGLILHSFNGFRFICKKFHKKKEFLKNKLAIID